MGNILVLLGYTELYQEIKRVALADVYRQMIVVLLLANIREL